MKKNANKGFSLVELIIVIAIMAVLIGVLAPQFIKHVENSRQATDVDNVQAIKTAIEVAVSNDEITSAVDIEVKPGASGAADTITTTATGLDGVTTTTNCKSTGWDTAGKWTYNVSGDDAYKWTGTASGTCKNAKGKNTDMASVFGL